MMCWLLGECSAENEFEFDRVVEWYAALPGMGWIAAFRSECIPKDRRRPKSATEIEADGIGVGDRR